MSLEGILWTASPVKHYGYGAGRAHPSVQWVQCPFCGAPKGTLCPGSDGEPHLDRHYARADAYRDLKKSQRLPLGAGGLGSARIIRLGSRFAKCGFRGCPMTGRHVLVTGFGKQRERHLYCCFTCGLLFTWGYRPRDSDLPALRRSILGTGRAASRAGRD